MDDAKEKLLLESLTSYFQDPVKYGVLVSTLTESSSTSLRVLDWFVTNYSRTHTKEVMQELDDFNVYSDYKSQLKAFQKKFFDPFCRVHDKSRLRKLNVCLHGRQLVTTTGQLNFFRWAIENRVVSFVQKHSDSIRRDLKANFKKRLRRTESSSASSSEETPTEEFERAYVICFE